MLYFERLCCCYVVSPVTPVTPTKDRKKDRSRSRSPFRSFRWKKSTPKSPLVQTASASDDEENISRAAAGQSSAKSRLVFLSIYLLIIIKIPSIINE